MSKAVLEAVASSSAHGISRAASTKATPLRVMWILLFLAFLALFLRSGTRLVVRLNENKLTKVYHLDQVPFVFPDLYFCPSNSYSGSYPFMLTSSEAELVNSEISRIVQAYELLYGLSNRVRQDAVHRAFTVQTSLPFYLTARYLIMRKQQSVLQATLTSNYRSYAVQMETFYHPKNFVCFKALLTEEQRQMMISTDSVLGIWLSTDPYFSDFNFTGHPIRPIVDKTNRSVPFVNWHPIQIVEDLKESGYTMLIVPPGAYPSLKFENNFHLAPGNAYSVKLEMQENAYSEDLHKTHCINDHPLVEIMDPLTGLPNPFTYSTAACYYLRKNSKLTEMFGCQMSRAVLLWKYRTWPVCGNVSQMTRSIASSLRAFTTTTKQGVKDFELEVTEFCKTRIPCTDNQYSARYSFGKWPSVGSSTDQFFANSFKFNETAAPALAKLVMIAKQMQSGNHSAHLEGIFRSYVSESLISVRISAASVTSSQVVLSWSYSFTDFLADTGGLLGLYIGCSMLTLCELLELMYVLVNQVFDRRSQPMAPPSDVAEAAGGGAESPKKVGDEDKKLQAV